MGGVLGAGSAEVLEYALELLAGAAAPAEAIVEHGVTVTPTLLEQALLGCATRLRIHRITRTLCWIATLCEITG